MSKAERKDSVPPTRGKANSAELGLGDNPLADDVLVDAFYAPVKKKTGRKPRGRQPLKDGRTFRLVTFSVYEDDVARLDQLLADARELGHRRVSRSQIVRLALRQVDLSQLPDEI